MNKIVLITRTRTLNQGNVALSAAWQDLLIRTFPDAAVRLVERCPPYLKRYTLESLASAADPVARFDAIARKLLAARPSTSTRDPSVEKPSLDTSIAPPVRFLKLRQKLRLRSRLMALGFGRKAYLDRLAYIADADMVVVNPAGEFGRGAADSALQYLIEARCAQLAGISTAIVNLSFESRDPTLLAVAEHVFENADLVELRDQESAALVREAGFDLEPLVLPDGVALCDIAPASPGAVSGIALIINGLKALEVGQWGALCDFFTQLSRDREIVLSSNEWNVDAPIWSRCPAMEDFARGGRGLDFDDYAAYLASHELVISSRLHSCVLGMLGGVPVIPIETGTFKISGFFKMIGLDDFALTVGADGWQDQLMSRIEQARSHREERIALQHEKLAVARERIDRELGKALREITTA